MRKYIIKCFRWFHLFFLNLDTKCNLWLIRVTDSTTVAYNLIMVTWEDISYTFAAKLLDSLRQRYTRRVKRLQLHQSLSWRSQANATHSVGHGFNTLRPRQNGRLFPEDIFKHFLKWELYSGEIFIGICSPGSTQKYSIIGSDTGLAPVRWQAIIWPFHGLV